MPYATPPMLADAPGAQELAEVATPEHLPVAPAALLDSLLRGTTPPSASDEERQAAEDALRVIAAAQLAADAIIDGYLGKKGYALPLTPCPPLVGQWARSITRYLLHKDRRTLESTDPIVRNYEDALKLLQQTANGRFSLHGADSVQIHKSEAQLASIAQVKEDSRAVFSRVQMRYFI